MSKNLFEIEQSMMNLLEYNINDETGEIIETEEEFNELYNSIQLDLQTKLDNTNCLQKMIDGEIEVIDKEIKRLTAEKSARNRKKEWLKNRVDAFVKRQFTDENGNIDEEGVHKYKLVLPGKLFCSCIKVFIHNLSAATITGIVTYPPIPSTISGLNSFTIFFA